MEIQPYFKAQKVHLINLSNIGIFNSEINDLNKSLLDGWKIIDKTHITYDKFIDKGIMCFTLEKNIPNTPNI